MLFWTTITRIRKSVGMRTSSTMQVVFPAADDPSYMTSLALATNLARELPPQEKMDALKKILNTEGEPHWYITAVA